VIAEQLTSAVAYHGEGPVWDPVARVLRWVDMLAGDVLTLGPDGVVERLHVGNVAAAVRPRAEGGLVVAVERGFVLVDGEGRVGAERTAFEDPEVRMNDGGCDPAGRFYCGTMAYDMSPGRGSLFRFDPAGTVTRVLDGLTISNGIAWSADGRRVHYIDSGTGRVDLFDYDVGSAELANRRPLATVDEQEGTPDGLALDSEGGTWVALFDGSAVHRYGTDGALDAVVRLPVSKVTACAFGGHSFNELFITTSRQDLFGDAEPAAGAVFRVEVGVRGLPTPLFAG
jgi:sugar lactone lactonase YvrE